jgi:hypothetical protein
MESATDEVRLALPAATSAGGPGIFLGMLAIGEIAWLALIAYCVYLLV